MKGPRSRGYKYEAVDFVHDKDRVAKMIEKFEALLTLRRYENPKVELKLWDNGPEELALDIPDFQIDQSSRISSNPSCRFVTLMLSKSVSLGSGGLRS